MTVALLLPAGLEAAAGGPLGGNSGPSSLASPRGQVLWDLVGSYEGRGAGFTTAQQGPKTLSAGLLLQVF